LQSTPELMLGILSEMAVVLAVNCELVLVEGVMNGATAVLVPDEAVMFGVANAGVATAVITRTRVAATRAALLKLFIMIDDSRSVSLFLSERARAASRRRSLGVCRAPRC
jgi:hypothetical protein